MQNLPMLKSFPITIDFLVYDRFSNHCMANCLEPFRAANTLSANDVHEWNFVTLDGLSVQSSSELRLMPDQKFGETKRADFLFIIASYDFRRHDSVASRRALRAAMKRYKNIIGLDSGPWMMAGAGIIDNHRATAHWDIIDEFSEEFVEVNVERQKYIFDGNIGTCGGGMAAFDLSLSIIREINGVKTAGKTGAQIQQLISNASNLGVGMDTNTRALQFATGGSFGGGLRIVGERGPELEATGASRIFSNKDTAKMFKNPELVEEIKSLRSEVAGLRSDTRQMQASNSKYVKRNYEINRKWDVEGLPEQRT